MTPARLRELNTALILQTIRDRGPQSRVELAARTGISAPTVTDLIGDMIEAGLLEARSDLREISGAGRPRVPIGFTIGRRAVLGLHVGVDHLSAVAVDLRGMVMIRRTTVMPRDGSLRGAALRLCARVRAAVPAEAVLLGAGLSRDDLTDRDDVPGQSLLAAATVDEPAGQSLDRALQEALGLPGAVTEGRQVGGQAVLAVTDPAREVCEDPPGIIVAVTVGPRVECALMVDHALHQGATDQAGRISHWPAGGARGPACSCGRTDCLAVVAGQTATVQTARTRGILTDQQGYSDLVAAARGHNRAAVGVLRNQARWLGRGLASLAAFLDPDQILLIGAPTEAGFTADLRQTLQQPRGLIDDSRLDLRPDLGDPAAAAAALFLNHYFTNPIRYEYRLKRRC